MKISNQRSFILDEYETEMEDYSSQNDETYSEEERPVKTKKTVVEDLGSETSALVQQDSGDSDAEKHKGCKYKHSSLIWLAQIDQRIVLGRSRTHLTVYWARTITRSPSFKPNRRLSASPFLLFSSVRWTPFRQECTEI